MSITTFPYFGTAMVLIGKEKDVFVRNYADEYGMDEDYVKDMISDREDLSPSNPDTKPLHVLGLEADDVYEGLRFFPIGYNGDDVNEIQPGCSDCYIIYTDNQLPEKSLFKPMYGSEEELIKELKDKVAKYLPDDFDYLGHVGFVAYCATC